MYFSKELLIQPYNIDTVVGEYTSGSGTITIKGNGWYKVEAVAGGGGGARSYYAQFSYASGGSGSGFVGEMYITADTYNYSVGSGGSNSQNFGGGAYAGSGGNTSITNIVTCNGGTGGTANWSSGQTAGSGGSAPTVSISTRNVTVNTAGNNGGAGIDLDASGSRAGGASVYGGYGKGGNAGGTFADNGVGGYLKITYKGAY